MKVYTCPVAILAQAWRRACCSPKLCGHLRFGMQFGAAAAGAIAGEDVISQAAQHGSEDEDEQVKCQITIGMAAKSVVINVDPDASVGQIKAKLKQAVDVDCSKLDFSKLDLTIGRGTEKVNLSNEFDYDKIMNSKRMKNIVKSNREGDCVPCCLVGLVVEHILIMMERNRPKN